MKSEQNTAALVSGFLKKFQECLVSKCKYSSGDKILAAVSGGVDSVVMIDLLSKSKIPFEIAHVNFQLRAEESDIDESFVLELSKKYKVEINTITFDTETFAKKQGISIEMAARKLRYDYFSNRIIEKKLDFIATAHHLDDNLETLILNIARGTSLKGFHGIKPISANLIRPMMFASKEEIQNYALKLNLDFRNDISNNDIRFKRNLIRNNITPELKKLNPAILDTVFRSCNLMSDYEEVINVFVAKSLKTILKKEGNDLIFDLIKLKKIGFINVLFFEALKNLGFSMEHVTLIRQLIDNETGKSFFLKEYQVYRDRDKLIIHKTSPINQNETLVFDNSATAEYGNISFKIDHISTDEIDEIKNPDFAFLDKDKLKFPLLIRTWKEGDRFWPCGMQGKKKISDYFTDQKISLHKKLEIPIFESAGKVVWVAGFRIDDEFKITEHTIRVLRITKINIPK